VKKRDHYRCQVPWCRSAGNCDVHHVKPWALGGRHTLENMITLCEAHHLAHHEGTVLIRREDGRFVIERNESSPSAPKPPSAEQTRLAAETALALKGLGFKPNEIKESMEKTRTHVGTDEKDLQQWITIALGYCPKGPTKKKASA
jgi:hypothetical protein